MSRLDELISQYCPNGVEVKKLREVSYMQRGTSLTKAKAVKGDIPVISGGKEPAFYCNSSNRNGETITVAGSGAGAGYVQYWNIPIFANDCFTVKGNEFAETKYLYYFMTNIQDKISDTKKGGGVPHVHISDVENFSLPVPPLEVQREIVHILDNFTELTDELTAELTARKKQYEFYRNKLLTFDNKVKIVPLADIADIGTGSSNTNEGLEEGKYPFYVRSQEPLRKNAYEYDETAIITAGDGVGVGKVFHYIEGKYALHQRAYRIHINTPDVLPRYYFHYMRSAFLPYIQKTMFQGSVASIRRPMLNQFPVPVPALDVQKRLVNVLDNFEAICTDLNIGLPAEIEARQKQYEYYRDLLLTFAETNGNLVTDRQTDRQTELNTIKLIQYVFGYAIVSLDYLVNFRNGKGHEKNVVSDGKYIVVNSKFISTDGQVKKYANEQICPLYKNDILMVMSDLPNGRALAKCYLVDEDDKYTLNQRIGAFTVRRPDLVTTKYLYYMLSRNPQLLRYDNGADQTNLRRADILNISIAIPKIKEQEKITKILDRFDTLCNDLSAGLPAEIEARQKQYEYYRDKLLSFKELPK